MSISSHTNDSHINPTRRGPRWLLGLGGVLMLTQTGCPSDSKGASPQQQCEALSDEISDKLVSCAEKLSGEKLSTSERRDLVDSVEEGIDCSKAVRVSDDYPTCIDAVQDASCDDVYSVDDDDQLVPNDPPSVCEEVILTR
jgi:hypothetical protein